MHSIFLSVPVLFFSNFVLGSVILSSFLLFSCRKNYIDRLQHHNVWKRIKGIKYGCYHVSMFRLQGINIEPRLKQSPKNCWLTYQTKFVLLAKALFWLFEAMISVWFHRSHLTHSRYYTHHTSRSFFLQKNWRIGEGNFFFL